MAVGHGSCNICGCGRKSPRFKRVKGKLAKLSVCMPCAYDVALSLKALLDAELDAARQQQATEQLAAYAAELTSAQAQLVPAEPDEDGGDDEPPGLYYVEDDSLSNGVSREELALARWGDWEARVDEQVQA